MEDLKMFDIVFADIPKCGGSVQCGVHPYVIIQNNIGNKYCPTVLGMSLTSSLKKHSLPTHCIIRKTQKNGLKQDSMLLGETLMQISKERIIARVGYIDDEKTKNDVINTYLANITGKKVYGISVWDKIVSMLFKLVKEGEHGDAA